MCIDFFLYQTISYNNWFQNLFSNCILLFNAISSLIFPYVYKNHRLYKLKYVTYDDFGAHVKKAILMLLVVTRRNEKTFFDNKLICSSMWVLFTILLSFLYHLYQVAWTYFGNDWFNWMVIFLSLQPWSITKEISNRFYYLHRKVNAKLEIICF